MTRRRQVRVAEGFFDQLDRVLPDERTVGGLPSATDFLLYEMPRLIERLATDYEGVTLPVESEPGLRVLITSGILVSHIAVYATVAADEAVDILALELDL